MANCYKCPVQKQIDALRDTCLNCSISNNKHCGLSNAGQRFVSLDSVPRPEIITGGRISPDYHPNDHVEDKVETPLNEEERIRYLKLIQCFADLTYDEAGLLASMMSGKTQPQIAAERNQSLQLVHWRWEKVCDKNPVWRSVANGVIGKGRGRKPKDSKIKQGRLI